MALSTVTTAPDCTDVFGTPADGFRTAEEWARAAFDGSLGAQALWRGVLQLRLGRLDAPDRVAGWRIVASRPERLVLEASSWHLEARLVWESSAERAQVRTELRFRNAAARAQWAALGWVHRGAVPRVLARARQRLRR